MNKKQKKRKEKKNYILLYFIQKPNIILFLNNYL